MKSTQRFIMISVLVALPFHCCVKAQDVRGSTVTANAQAAHHNDDLDYPPLYRSQELDLDLFGSGSLGEDTLEHLSESRFRHHSLWGGGGGLTYFFCRYVGVGGEFDAEGRSHQFVDSADGNVYVRVPILETGVAPYIFGGGGYQFEDFHQSFGQAGGGVEYRFCRHLGIFVDGRYVMANKSEDYGEARAGFRFVF